MKLELELDVEAVVSAIREIDADEVLSNVDSSTLAEMLSGYFAAEDDVLSEDYVRDIAREEAESVGGGLDEEGVTEHATSLLNSIPTDQSGLCTLGNAFQGGLNKVLAMPATVEVLKEALGLNVEYPASGAIENGEIVEEPTLVLHGVKLAASETIAHVSVDEDQATNLACETDRHGTLVTLDVPLSLARQLLDGSIPQCSARSMSARTYRLVPNAVFCRVENDDATKIRCGETVRQWVADQDRQPVTAECWIVVFNDRSVWGPFATREEAARAQTDRCSGMDTLVRQATLPLAWR